MAILEGIGALSLVSVVYSYSSILLWFFKVLAPALFSWAGLC